MSCRVPPLLAVLLGALILVAASGCSVRKFAIGQLGSALAQGGGAFAQEDDVRLAGEAIPFSLKLVESLLLQAPDNTDLCLAAASGYTQYAYGWVQQPADFLEAGDPAAAQAERARAARLYLRAHRYARAALAQEFPGFEEAFKASPETALAKAGKQHVPLLYWSAASLGAAIASAKQDADLVARVPEVAAFIDRAAALDPDWNGGAIHGFLVSFEPARPGAAAGSTERAKAALARARSASHGTAAAPLVSYAETICVATQDRKQFLALLDEALAMDPGAAPDQRLANRLYQDRARWLRGRVDDLILE